VSVNARGDHGAAVGAQRRLTPAPRRGRRLRAEDLGRDADPGGEKEQQRRSLVREELGDGAPGRGEAGLDQRFIGGAKQIGAGGLAVTSGSATLLCSAGMRARLIALPLALSLAGAGCAGHEPAAVAPPGVDASDSWTRLVDRLPGTWVATTERGSSLEVGYRVVSRGSALLETFGAAAAEQTLSVYHRDGRALMLTHYCAQGNQVRLRATEASDSRVTFVYVDATNVDPSQSVMHELTFVLGPDTLERTEVYRASDGTRETSVLHFVRR
jgi:hypothetical protein